MKDFISKLSLSMFAVLAPVYSVMLAAGIMILLDLITGLWKAIKKKEHITSNGLRRTVSKFLAYQIAIITAYIMEVQLTGGLFPVVKIVGSLIAITEGKSIFENLHQITGINFVKMIIDKLQERK